MTDRTRSAAFATPAAMVAQELAVDPQSGLDDSAIAKRRELHGPNQLRAHARKSVLVILAHQFKGVIVWLLASGICGNRRPGASKLRPQ